MAMKVVVKWVGDSFTIRTEILLWRIIRNTLTLFHILQSSMDSSSSSSVCTTHMHKNFEGELFYYGAILGCMGSWQRSGLVVPYFLGFGISTTTFKHNEAAKEEQNDVGGMEWDSGNMKWSTGRSFVVAGPVWEFHNHPLLMYLD